MVTKGYVAGDTKVVSAGLAAARRMPWRFRNVTLDRIHDDLRSSVEAAINEFAHPIQGRKGLLLSGDVGVGKTAALWVLVKYYYAYRFLVDKTEQDPNGSEGPEQWNEDPASMIYLTHFKLSGELRDYHRHTDVGANQPESYWRPLVAIDDLGTRFEDKAGWNIAIEYDFFNRRWERGLPLYCTTNKSIAELRETEGWARIADRLADPAWIITAGTDSESQRG